MTIAYNRIQSKMRQAAGVSLSWNLTPTQAAYAMSTAVINGIDGPMGPGKSYASATAYAIHAKRNLDAVGIDVLHVYVLRDTLENLKKSPIPTIEKAYGSLFELRNQSKEGYIYTNPLIHLEFIGLADGGDLSKLQGPEVGLIHLEECCPIADVRRYNAGIAEEVFNIALVRCTRQENIIPRLQCSTNPGDEDHWYYRRIVEPPDGSDPETPLITKRRFYMDPANPADMIYLKDISKQAAMVAWKGEPAMYKRMVEGEWAQVYRGKKVAVSFNKARHVSPRTLHPVAGFPAFRWWDGWGEPRCVLGQQFPSGQCQIYKVIRDHTDIRACSEKVKIELQHPRWKSVYIPEWRDIGDATMTRHDQSDRSQSSAKVVEDSFGGTFEPGVATWETGLKLAILTAFRASTSDGEPCILITPEEKPLIAAFEGRWHYPTMADGQIKPGSKPVKSEDSHEADAVANGVSRMQPWAPYKRNVADTRRAKVQQKKRAASYSLPRVAYG
jgi:hypothetical protein